MNLYINEKKNKIFRKLIILQHSKTIICWPPRSSIFFLHLIPISSSRISTSTLSLSLSLLSALLRLIRYYACVSLRPALSNSVSDTELSPGERARTLRPLHVSAYIYTACKSAALARSFTSSLSPSLYCLLAPALASRSSSWNLFLFLLLRACVRACVRVCVCGCVCVWTVYAVSGDTVVCESVNGGMGNIH